MSPIQRREAIIDASAEIKRLRTEITERNQDLAARESALDQLIAGEESPLEGLPILKRAMVEVRDKTLNAQIIDALESMNDLTFSAEEVVSLIPNANLASVRSALARLSDSGKIKRSDRGKYQGITTTSQNGRFGDGLQRILSSKTEEKENPID